MTTYKDWQPGEYRARVQLVTDKGISLDYYIPHLTIKEGEELLKFVNDLFVSRRNRLMGCANVESKGLSEIPKTKS